MTREPTTAADYVAIEAATEARYGAEPVRIGGWAYDECDVPSASDLGDEL